MSAEILYMSSGQEGKDFGFGPVRHLPIVESEREGLEIRPLTIMIGEQGTGKSLFSQIIYFFRNLPYLIGSQYAQSASQDPDKLIRQTLDALRSDQRALGVFANPRAKFEWDQYTVNLLRANRSVGINTALRGAISEWRANDFAGLAKRQALLIPAERVLYSHGKQATWQYLRLASTLTDFALVMEEAMRTFGNWVKGMPETPEGKKIREMGIEILQGEAKLYGETWKWKVPGETMQFDIDMASTGQKANWPLIMLAEALFEWRERGLIATPFSIHIEEPEIHLHPLAQTQMMKLIAFLVNQGFRVLLTTHSPTILYTLNNLLTAAALLGEQEHPDVPEREFRLTSDKVAAYLFAGEQVESIIRTEKVGLDGEKEIPWLDENKLRAIDKDLGKELSRIRYYGLEAAGS